MQLPLSPKVQGQLEPSERSPLTPSPSPPKKGARGAGHSLRESFGVLNSCRLPRASRAAVEHHDEGLGTDWVRDFVGDDFRSQLCFAG